MNEPLRLELQQFILALFQGIYNIISNNIILIFLFFISVIFISLFNPDENTTTNTGKR
jgi:hypothetical protein